jgi:hypothetical protein
MAYAIVMHMPLGLFTLAALVAALFAATKPID